MTHALIEGLTIAHNLAVAITQLQTDYRTQQAHQAIANKIAECIADCKRQLPPDAENHR